MFILKMLMIVEIHVYRKLLLLCINFTVYLLYNLLEVQGTSVIRYVSCAICQLYIRSRDLVVYDLVALVD